MSTCFKLFLSLIVFPIMIFAQKYDLSGMIIDSEKGKLLSGAHVIALSETGKSYATVSNSKGMFTLKSIPSGNYTLNISHISYSEISKKVVLQNKNTDIGVIKLNEEHKKLQEIEIVEKLPQATMKGDTTQFNADAFKTHPDASTEDLIQKMPGVVVENGKVQAQGEDVEEVTVDGKPFFGNNPKTTLQTLPADVVDKIQIFDKQSEQSEFTGFNDGETSKTINIITKEEMRNSTFGKVYGGYGLDNKYMLGGNINVFDDNKRISFVGLINNVNQQNFTSEDLLGVSSSGQMGGRTGGGAKLGLGKADRLNAPPSSDGGSFMVEQAGGISETQSYGVNYSSSIGKKVEVSGSYFFNRSTNTNNSELTRTYISDADSGIVYNEIENSSSTNSNHRFNFKLEYEINDNNSLLLMPRLSVQEYTSESYTYSSTKLAYNENDLPDQTESSYTSDLSGLNFSNDLLFRHKFNKKSRTISLMVRTENTQNEGNSLTKTDYSDTTYSELNQQGILDKNNWSLTSNLVYTEPIGSHSMMLITYENSWKDNSITNETFSFDTTTNQYSDIKPVLSNTSESKYFAKEFGTGIVIRKGLFMFNTNLSYQFSDLASDQLYPNEIEISRNYGNFVPRFMLMANISKKQKLMLGYRTHTSNPSIEQLQEIIDNSDAYQLTTGNPQLDQSYQHSLFLRYSNINTDNSRVFYLMLFGNATKDYIADNVHFVNKDTLLQGGVLLPAGGQISTPENMDGYFSIRGFTTYGLPIYKLKSNFNINLSAGFSQEPGVYNNQSYFNKNASLSSGFVLSSNISENVDFTISTTSEWNKSKNDLSSSSNSEYYSQNSKANIRLLSNFGLNFTSDISHQFYSGLSDGYNESYFLWNASIGKKFLKNNAAELRLTVYDLLNQNQSIERIVNDNYIEDSRTEVLQRYVMLSFIYKIKNIKS